MNAKQFAAYLRRDTGCVHCGVVDTAIPHHRANRGMGSMKSLNRPSNIIVMCSEVNGLMESDAEWATRARDFGWKISKHSNPEFEPVYYPLEGQWFYLDDLFERAVLYKTL